MNIANSKTEEYFLLYKGFTAPQTLHIHEGVDTSMKNVQIVFNIQVPDHVSEEEVNTRLNQVISTLMAQEFGGNSLTDQSVGLPPDGHDGQVGHA